MTSTDNGHPGSAIFAPGPILLLGAPGVGKGTQAQRLLAAFRIPQISTGDLLRQNVQSATALGLAAKRVMDDGKLVPDTLVNEMVHSRLRQPDTAAGYILDGFPRTSAQAAWLDDELTQGGRSASLAAILIEVDTPELLRRVTGRRTCTICHQSYNIYSQPPQRAGLCDREGSKLQQRSDDTEEAFGRRMAEFASKTSAVIEHYRQQGRFRSIDGIGSVEEVGERVLGALRDLRAEGR